MNCVGKLIAYIDPDFLILSKTKQMELQCTVLLYIFGGCKVQVLNDLFKKELKWSGSDCIVFRDRLARSGYIMKNFKLYFYSKVLGRKRSGEDYGLTPKDVAFVGKVIRSNSKAALRLMTLCTTWGAKGYKPRSIDGLDIGLELALKQVYSESYFEKFIYKKFRFLTQSNQKDAESLKTEMLEYGLRSVYRAYPRIDSLLHMVNLIKTGSRNRGQNIIKEETTQKRKRLIANEDGTFSGTLLSLNREDFEQTFAMNQNGSSSAISTCNSLMCGLDGQSVEGERPSDVNRKRDLQQMVGILLGQCRDEKGRQLMNLLMGLHDEKFSEYLGQDNDQAMLRLSREQYADKARKFLGMSVPDAKSYVMVWRSQLKEFRN